MTKERWPQVKSLLALAFEQPPENREMFLVEAVGGDDELLKEVLSLLAAHDRATGFSLEDGPPAPTSFQSLDKPSTDDAVGVSFSKICTRCRSRYGPLVFVCPQDGEPLADDPEALVGVTLDGLYRIERLVGLGAMGRVYGARHETLRDRVAIKVLRTDLALNPDFIKRFTREGRAARAIRHPNAVTVYDLRTTSEGLTYMVQEFIDGHTLRDELAEHRRFSLAEVVAYLEPVASALDEAHAHGIVHRDLKPENIMIGKVADKSVVKLTDLGIAKLHETLEEPIDDVSALTEPGQIMGTPHYMPPEQWGVAPEDGGPEIDGRADVYSFGVIVYEMLAGKKPFAIRSVRQLCMAHVSRPVPNICDEVPELPAAVGRAIERAMSKNRTDRHASCGHLMADLKAAIPVETSDAGVVASSDRLPERSHRWGMIGAVGVLAATLLAAVGLWFQAIHDVGGGVARGAAPAAMAIRSVTCVAEVQRYRNGQPVKDPLRVATDRTLIVEQGDRVRIVLTSQDGGFLYVLNETVGGAADLRVLFPVSWANGGSPHLDSGKAITLPPDASNWIEFDDERGTEAFWVIWSTRPIDSLAGIEQLTNAKDRGVLDPERAQSARDLLHAARPSFVSVDRATGLTTIGGASGVVVHRIEIQHY